MHGSPAQQMQMQVIHRLAAVVAGVHDYAITGGEFFFARDLCYRPQQMAQQRGVFLARFRERNDVLARHNQQVNRRLRMNVRKGDTFLILVNTSRGNASIDDLAK